MPGPISDSLDPEWGTGEIRQGVEDALSELYETASRILGHTPPIYIVDLVRRRPRLLNGKEPLGRTIGTPATQLSEWEWRIIRFALERARDSV
jgi:hypothetical protein